MRHVNKWATFASSIPVALSSGVVYCFSIWGADLKEEYGLTQTQLNLVGSAANVGGFTSILAGLVYDALQDYHALGPRLTLLLGGAVNAAGYMALYGAAHRWWNASYWQLLALACFACGGGTWTDSSTLVTNVRNFPQFRGLIVGVLKSCVGLSPSLYTCFYRGWFAPQGREFLKFLAFAPSAAVLIALPFANHVPFLQRGELKRGWRSTQSRVAAVFALLGALAVFLAAATLLAQGDDGPARSLHRRAAIGAALALVPLALLPVRAGRFLCLPAEARHYAAAAAEKSRLEEKRRARRGHRRGWRLWRPRARTLEESLLVPAPPGEVGAPLSSSDGGDDPSFQDSLSRGPPSQPPSSPTQHIATGPLLAVPASPDQHLSSQQPCIRAPPDLTPWTCLGNLDFWLLFAVCTAGMGTGLVFVNQAAQIALAASRPMSAATVLVSLFGVCNFAGRILLGWLPERLLHARGVPRPASLVVVAALSSTLCLALAPGTPAALPPLAAMSGFAFGGYWSLMPSLASELFGMRHFASNYCLLQGAPAVGGLVLAGQLAGWLYDRAMRAMGQEGTTCRGALCFRDTWLVMCALCLGGVAASAALYRRTRRRYFLQYQRLHAIDDADEEED